MALTVTIFKAALQIADMDRNYYRDHAVTLARHPSETDERMMVRLLAFVRHKDDKGLYVSTGGFSKDARYEAERASIPVTLMDLDDLVKAILEHYEGMDPDTARLLSLRKIYWPG